MSGGDANARLDQPMSHERAEHLAMRYGLPFVPGEQRPDGTWAYACYNLGSDGRCTDYENRPDLCRRYVAGSDGLCVHYWARPDVAVAGLLEEAEALEAA